MKESLVLSGENDEQERPVLGVTADGATVRDRIDSHFHAESGLTKELLATAISTIDTKGNTHVVEQVDFDTLLRESDVISIHAPFTAETANTFDKEAFSKMKDGAILINTARGGLIDETAMMEALNSGKLFAAGLDVLRDEPPVSDNPLFHTDKTSITGHIAWLTKESRLRAVDMAIENFIHYLNAIPTSVIN